MGIKLFTYKEHCQIGLSAAQLDIQEDVLHRFFKKEHRGKTQENLCFSLHRLSDSKADYLLKASYFVGLDWINPQRSALLISPKLNNEKAQIDLFYILNKILEQKEGRLNLNQLLQINWNQKPIPINQEQDFLSPFLLIQFLGLLKKIVKKGVKKSYFEVDRNLRASIKGKIQVGKSIQHNHFQNKKEYTYCRFQEFGLDTTANRCLKKALIFCQGYLSAHTNTALREQFNYIFPAFKEVSAQVSLKELKAISKQAFSPDYQLALQLADMIIQRFSFKFSNTLGKHLLTPPFWIDMSKLFELYVLRLLKARFSNQVKYQFKYYGNELDYVLKSPAYKMVIDAKYKPIYQSGMVNDDMRQLSGYARLGKVYDHLEVEKSQTIDCLVIYPDQENGLSNLEAIDLKGKAIRAYRDMYKLGVKLPVRGY